MHTLHVTLFSDRLWGSVVSLPPWKPFGRGRNHLQAYSPSPWKRRAAVGGVGQRGGGLMSRRRSPAEPRVGPWDETMAGRQWAALQALCALHRCLALPFVFFCLFLSICVCFPRTFSRSHPPTSTHTHTFTHTHRNTQLWTVCKKAERTMKTKTGCQREFICPGGMIFPPTNCNWTQCRGGAPESGCVHRMLGMGYLQINTSCCITVLIVGVIYFREWNKSREKGTRLADCVYNTLIIGMPNINILNTMEIKLPSVVCISVVIQFTKRIQRQINKMNISPTHQQ